MKQLRGPLDLVGVNDGQAPDAVLPGQSLAVGDDRRVVVAARPGDASRVTGRQVAMLRRGLQLVVRGGQAKRIVVARVDIC